MTPCHVLRREVAAYADDELGVDAALAVERHLAACGACRRAVGRLRHLSRALRELHPTDAPPPHFEARVRVATLGPATVARRTVAVCAGMLGLGLAAWLGTSFWPIAARDSRATPTSGAAAAHGAAIAADTAPAVTAAATLHTAGDRAAPLELVSSDVATVNAWLRERLGFPAAVGVPGSPAITLIGAGIVTLGNHPAGLVRYRMDGHDVSLFLLAEPTWSDETAPVRVGATDFRVFRRNGVEVVAWTHAALSYLLISADGVTTGAACGACHGGGSRPAIADFVAAVAGRASDT